MSAAVRALTMDEMVPGLRVYAWEGDLGTVVLDHDTFLVFWDDGQLDPLAANTTDAVVICGSEQLALRWAGEGV